MVKCSVVAGRAVVCWAGNYEGLRNPLTGLVFLSLCMQCAVSPSGTGAGCRISAVTHSENSVTDNSPLLVHC